MTKNFSHVLTESYINDAVPDLRGPLFWSWNQQGENYILLPLEKAKNPVWAYYGFSAINSHKEKYETVKVAHKKPAHHYKLLPSHPKSCKASTYSTAYFTAKDCFYIY